MEKTAESPGQAHILVVEDSRTQVELVRYLLKKAGPDIHFEMTAVDTVQDALSRISQGGIDLVLLDLSLPDGNGLDTLKRVHEAAPLIPIVISSGHEELEIAYTALENGAQDYLLKGTPDALTLIRILRFAILRKKAEIQNLGDNLEQAFLGINAVATPVLETIDPYTTFHQKRVASLCRAIAKHLVLPPIQIQGIFATALIHDIGKIQMSTEILNKPDRLSDEELSLVKTHPQIGFNLIKALQFPWPVAEIIHQHHERLDGSGYPRGLKAAEILFEAKILAVSDVVEALLSNRPYRPAYPLKEAFTIIANQRGTLFDPIAVGACLQVFHQGFGFT